MLKDLSSLHSNSVDILYDIAAIINSTPFSFFAKAIANPQDGNFFKFNKQFLNPVPFPVQAVKNVDALMLDLSETAREIERCKLRMMRNQSRANRYQSLISGYWNSIDNITCELYQRTSQEKELVLRQQREDRII